MKRILIALSFIAATLAGCSNLSTDAKMAVSCQSYASTLSSLAEFRAAGQLDEDDIQTVNTVIEVAGPICRDNVAEGDEIETLANALRKLTGIESEVRDES